MAFFTCYSILFQFSLPFFFFFLIESRRFVYTFQDNTSLQLLDNLSEHPCCCLTEYLVKFLVDYCLHRNTFTAILTPTIRLPK